MPNSVLVVEDDHDQRNVMQEILHLYGFRATTVANGQEAIDFLTSAERTPRMIFLDMVMPVMSGPEFLGELHSGRYPELEHIPVVAVSAVIGLVDHERHYRCIAAISKPCDFGHIVKVARIFAGCDFRH